MPRGGSRKHPSDCKCGSCPKLGRKKADRPTNANVAAKVLAQAKAEKLWLEIIEYEKKNLTDPRGSTTGLREALKYLENRAYGNCMDTVNHIHDKPIEMNVTVSLSEAIQKARKRVAK